MDGTRIITYYVLMIFFVGINLMPEAAINNIIDGQVDDFASSLLLFERMEALLNQRLEAQPNNETLLFQLAGCKRKQGKLDKALKHYSDLRDRYPLNQKYRFIVDALCGNLEGCSSINVHSPYLSPLVLQAGFLNANIVQEALDYICKHKTQFKPAGVMNEASKSDYETDARNNTCLSLKGHPLKKIFSRHLHSKLNEISYRLGLKTFDIGQIEVQLRAYHHGEYFRAHHDAVLGRRINFVYFFHPEPKRYRGGELVIFDTNTETMEYNHDFTRIIPTHNQIVFFPSNYIHAVLPAFPYDDDFLSGRFVINGHIREKPKSKDQSY